MPIPAAMMVLTLMTLTNFVAAGDDFYRKLSLRKFTIDNIFPFDGTPPCPPSNPNTVAFYPSSSNAFAGTVTIVGEFDAANLGVCSGSSYAVPPGTTIQYYIYGNWIVFHVVGRVSSAAKVVFQQGKILAIGVGNNYYVSDLHDVGPAP